MESEPQQLVFLDSIVNHHKDDVNMSQDNAYM